MNSFSIIVAVDQKNGIGKNGQLPWHLPGDLKHFKEITTQTLDPQKKNAVIMGRKTWESLPEKFRPLPSRINVVITSQKDFPLPQEVFKALSIREALALLDKSAWQSKIENIFVIGGALVFQEAITYPECQSIYLTNIEQTFDCDVRFPALPTSFKEVSRTPVRVENSMPFYFSEWRKHNG